MIEEESMTRWFMLPNLLGEKNGRIVYEGTHYVVFYIPGRTVYIDATQGSQYYASEYVVLEKEPSYSENGAAIELFRFPRSN